MRLILIAAAITCIACATGPSDSIAGNWSSWGPGHTVNPAGPMGLTLSESGDTVTGVGSFGGERFTITGQYVRPAIRLTLTPTFNGQLLTSEATSYVGKAIDPSKIELNGTTFYRQ